MCDAWRRGAILRRNVSPLKSLQTANPGRLDGQATCTAWRATRVLRNCRQADPNNGEAPNPPPLALPGAGGTVRTLIVIPARGGSKGLPQKNLRAVGGVSLVGRAVVTARAFVAHAAHGSMDILVDTDSNDIATEAKRWGAPVPFLRSPHLAGDTTPTLESVLFLLDRLADQGPAIDAVVLLQPTSPLRRAEDVTQCWAGFDPATSPAVVSVTATALPGDRLGRR